MCCFLGHLKGKTQRREIPLGPVSTPVQLPSVRPQFFPPVPPSSTCEAVTVFTSGKPDEDECEPCSPEKGIGYDDEEEDDDTGSDSEAASEKEEETKMTEEEVNKMHVAEEEKVSDYTNPQFIVIIFYP